MRLLWRGVTREVDHIALDERGERGGEAAVREAGDRHEHQEQGPQDQRGDERDDEPPDVPVEWGERGLAPAL